METTIKKPGRKPRAISPMEQLFIANDRFYFVIKYGKNGIHVEFEREGNGCVNLWEQTDGSGAELGTVEKITPLGLHYKKHFTFCGKLTTVRGIIPFDQITTVYSLIP